MQGGQTLSQEPQEVKVQEKSFEEVISIFLYLCIELSLTFIRLYLLFYISKPNSFNSS